MDLNNEVLFKERVHNYGKTLRKEFNMTILLIYQMEGKSDLAGARAKQSQKVIFNKFIKDVVSKIDHVMFFNRERDPNGMIGYLVVDDMPGKLKFTMESILSEVDSQSIRYLIFNRYGRAYKRNA